MAQPAYKVEFDVEMTCNNCVNLIDKALRTEGLQSFQINLTGQSVLVESSLPSEQVREIIQSTGRRAVVKGIGTSTESGDLGSGVVMIDGGNVRGIIRLVQTSETECLFDGTVDGLSTNQIHSVHIHKLGDMSRGCESCGDVYTGSGDGYTGSEQQTGRPIGNLGEEKSNDLGRLTFTMTSQQIKLWDVIGRSIVISSQNERLACGIIARSAGLFENTKRICACDGISIWDERDVPVAGTARQHHANSNL